MFVIEQALSVRALQELVTAAGNETVSFILIYKEFFNIWLNINTKSKKKKNTSQVGYKGLAYSEF